MLKSNLSEILCEVIRNTTRDTIEHKLKLENCEITVSSALKEGEDNFYGTVYRVSSNKDDANNSKLKMILKIVPQNEARRYSVQGICF